ncbi:MAG: response regulator [gamma proteobacterium endosymbiont of Lamellibrachia anaximandri]|nr:response regulator [gamma proteobacterium endosymbiont of Lamellibrachia anaximandri]MBL3533953.1 response regulator [gamma proteobacterium endosymbiont of Lamellibrachia anaximandri]
MSALNDKILLVDDDRNLLDAFKRQFRKKLNLVTATSGADGIQAVRDDGSFAVAISDMQMPNMDGIEFLSKVRQIAPNTVRIMLTGNANLNVAIDAINEGNIFRFLNKPVETDTLYKAITDGVRQYRLVTAEKILITKTLKGAVDLLTDILSLVNPTSFSQASRIKRHVRTMVKHLSLEDSWNYELAAMLSQLGCITLPAELLDKLNTGKELSDTERSMVQGHPQIAGRLLKHIPRLETVATMVEHQADEGSTVAFKEKLNQGEKGVMGGQLLKVAIAFDNLLNHGETEKEALALLKDLPQVYDPALVKALAAGDDDSMAVKVMKLPISRLAPEMILDQNILSHGEILLVAKGQELSQAVILRLQASEKNEIITGPIQVVVTST